MNTEQQELALKKSNTRMALSLASLALASLCLAAYGVSKVVV